MHPAQRHTLTVGSYRKKILIMTATITIENENTFKKACLEGINLFLGSGFSVLAKDSSGATLPLGKSLREELASNFALDNVEGLSLSQVCMILESDRRDQLYEFLKCRFSVASFDPLYHALQSLKLRTIFTTNVDDLLFKVFEESDDYYLNDMGIRGPAFADRAAVDFTALHGSILHPEEPLAFSSTDVAASFSADPDKWHFLTGRLQQYPTLFWGYSLVS